MMEREVLEVAGSTTMVELKALVQQNLIMTCFPSAKDTGQNGFHLYYGQDFVKEKRKGIVQIILRPD